jgi:putative oxidoreductase
MVGKLLTRYYANAGLFVLRIGIGIMYIYHGAPKLAGGPERWEKVGMAMSHLGIDFMPAFWGFMAASSEFFGAVCLMLGLLFRPASFFMAFTMAVAATMHLKSGDGLLVASHAIENCILFISLFFIGPGRYAIDQKLFRK